MHGPISLGGARVSLKLFWYTDDLGSQRTSYIESRKHVCHVFLTCRSQLLLNPPSFLQPLASYTLSHKVMRISTTLLLAAASAARLVAGYWMEDIPHQGRSTFNADPDNYVVFRNVKDYGAVGDGGKSFPTNP